MKIEELKQKYKQVYELEDGNFNVSTKSPNEVNKVDYWNAHTAIDQVYGLEGNWGLLDKEGNVLVEPQYIYPFIECGENYQVMLPYEYAKEQEEEIIITLKHGLLDKKGNCIIPIQYLFMEAMDNTGTYFRVYDPTLEKDGVLDKENHIIVPFVYDFIPASPDLALMIHTKYCSIYPDHINQVKICNKDLYGVFDLNLKKEIIKPKYNYLKIIGTNKFLVGENHENCTTLINEKEETIGKEEEYEQN